jgi:hypothetical protein
MNCRLAARHEKAILTTLGPTGRMIDDSKTAYRDTHPDHLPVFNANVCLGSSKIWHGDLDLTIDEEALLDLASRSEEVVSVLYESDGRFRYEDHPLVAEAVYSAAPSGHSLVDSAWAERRPDGRLYLRSHPRPPRWRRPARPRFWRFWEVSAECERTSSLEGDADLALPPSRPAEHIAAGAGPRARTALVVAGRTRGVGRGDVASEWPQGVGAAGQLPGEAPWLPCPPILWCPLCAGRRA